MVSIDDLQEILHGIFKEPISGPLKFKVAEIHHLENRHISTKNHPISVKFGT